ncbi:MAG TPA: glycosyltransferase, partial [Planctomycetota bacterium]|nr:glycosyltransferase [Planctomycetota bacterium]
IVPSVWLGDRVAKSALSDKPMHVVPNGVPFERFAGADGTGVRHRLGIPPDVRVVLFAGQMQTNWKGYQDLLRIAARILETDENIWFVFVGPTGEPPRGHPRILFTGAVTYDEIPRYYAAADVFAYPTHADVFGLVVVEAMAAGLPVVTYRTGGVAELVLKGTTGFVIEEGDETGFETALRNLLDDLDRRRIMGRAARERVKRHFTLDEQVARTEGLYGQVIAEREAKSGRTPGTREPLVSVVMPAYNTGRFIAQAIRSVLRQTWTHWELIVIDDGSTDDTAAVVATFSDPRIRCISRENTGLSAARNEGIRRARGEYIAFLDSDDLWFPEKLAAQAKILEEDPEAGLTYSNYWFVDEDGVRTGAPRFSFARLADGWCLEKLLVRNAVLGPTTVVLRRSVLDRVGLFHTDLRASEDWDMWRRVAVHCKFRYLPRALGAYRIRRGSLTGRHDLMGRCERMVMDRAFADPEVKQRIPADRRRRLRRRADAVHFYNIGSRQLRAGDVAQAVRSFMRSMRAALYNFRQAVMLVFSLVLLLPFVSRDRLLTAIGK